VLILAEKSITHVMKNIKIMFVKKRDAVQL
jgi:hypothetical protein